MFPNGGPTRNSRRRGVVAVLVAVVLVTLLGFAALTVDVGAMYNARAELQRSADAAALAAASRLSDYSTGDPQSLATSTAEDLTTHNGVFNRTMHLDGGDVVFGRGDFDPTAHTFTFTPTTNVPDAVRVRVRMTTESSNGPLGLFFAPIFGRMSTDVSAQATAVMVPRDIAIVADLSSSHTDDSEFRNYHLTEVKMWEPWDGLPGGFGEIGSPWNAGDIQPGWVMPDGSVPQAAGPAWGYMKKMGFGNLTVPTTYDPTTDTGMVRLAYGSSWSDAQLTSFLTAQGYSASERSAIMTNAASDTTTIYPLRVAVALGLADWNSGIAGGRWSIVGAPAGNGNTSMSTSEVQWTQSIMGRSVSSSATIFRNYINFVRSNGTTMYAANTNLRYRFGVKTFVNYLLDVREQHSLTPELSNAPHYPMQAVKDSVQVLTDYLSVLDSNDQVSLEIYATSVRHEVDLSNNFQLVSDRMNAMHAGYYDSSTNTGGGLYAGIDELTSVRARPLAKKVIVLLTDGIANVDASGTPTSEASGSAYAVQAAEDAAAQGIRIFTVAVGAAANTALMAQIADIGDGEMFVAAGSVEEYAAALQNIFVTIGGRRPVALVE